MKLPEVDRVDGVAAFVDLQALKLCTYYVKDGKTWKLQRSSIGDSTLDSAIKKILPSDRKTGRGGVLYGSTWAYKVTNKLPDNILKLLDRTIDGVLDSPAYHHNLKITLISQILKVRNHVDV